MIFSHYFQLQLAQPTWLRCRAQVDEPKPRPSVPGPDQLKLDKAGTTSLRKVHPTITQQCIFSTHITSRDRAPPNLSVAGIGCARLAPLALPRFRPAIHQLGLEDLKTTRLPGLPMRCQQMLKALILPPVQQIMVSTLSRLHGRERIGKSLYALLGPILQ